MRSTWREQKICDTKYSDDISNNENKEERNINSSEDPHEKLSKLIKLCCSWKKFANCYSNATLKVCNGDKNAEKITSQPLT